MPTFGFSQNWGTGVPRPTSAAAAAQSSPSPTLVRSSSPSGSNDLSWLSALPALVSAAGSVPGILSGESGALSGATGSALQALASSQGHGTAGSFIPAVISLLNGDEAGALRSGSGAATAAGAVAAGAPSWAIGPLATLASGLVAGDDSSRIKDSLINSGVGSAFSALGGPVGALTYQALRALGFNPAQGVNKGLSKKNYDAEGGDPGKLGGFFGTVGDYEGYTPGAAYYPGTNQLEQNLRLESLDGAEKSGAHLTNDSPAEQAARSAMARAAEQQAAQREYQQQEERAAAVAQLAAQERANAAAIQASNAAPSSSGSTSSSGGNTGRFGQAVGPGSSYINTPSSSSGGWSNTGGYSSDGSTNNGSGMSGGTGNSFAAGGSVKNAWGF